MTYFAVLGLTRSSLRGQTCFEVHNEAGENIPLRALGIEPTCFFVPLVVQGLQHTIVDERPNLEQRANKPHRVLWKKLIGTRDYIRLHPVMRWMTSMALCAL